MKLLKYLFFPIIFLFTKYKTFLTKYKIYLRKQQLKKMLLAMDELLRETKITQGLYYKRKMFITYIGEFTNDNDIPLLEELGYFNSDINQDIYTKELGGFLKDPTKAPTLDEKYSRKNRWVVKERDGINQLKQDIECQNFNN